MLKGGASKKENEKLVRILRGYYKAKGWEGKGEEGTREGGKFVLPLEFVFGRKTHY